MSTPLNIKVEGNENKNIGYNIKTREYEDFLESGIIDPTKVTRCALENAASIAGTILLTECTVVNNPKDKEEPQLGGMPGMF
jgi:chaperonin GroEL